MLHVVIITGHQLDVHNFPGRGGIGSINIPRNGALAALAVDVARGWFGGVGVCMNCNGRKHCRNEEGREHVGIQSRIRVEAMGIGDRSVLVSASANVDETKKCPYV